MLAAIGASQIGDGAACEEHKHPACERNSGQDAGSNTKRGRSLKCFAVAPVEHSRVGYTNESIAILNKKAGLRTSVEASAESSTIPDTTCKKKPKTATEKPA